MRIGVDVGGTNTDAVVMDGRTVLAWHKAATTGNVSDGIVSAIGSVLGQAKIAAGDVHAVMIGTTHFTNAFVQRQRLLPVGIIRIALPSSRGVPPLTDWPADIAEVVGGHRHMITGGYQYDGRQADDRTSWRVLLDWQPADTVDVLLNLHGGKDKSDVMLIKIDNPFSAEDDGDDNPYRSGASVDPHLDIETWGGALTVNWELSETLTLTSVTGYEDFSRLHVEDRDATSLEQLDGFFDNDIEQFSQEVRLTHQGTDTVVIGGLFYGRDEIDTRDRFDSTDLLAMLGLAGMNSIGNEYLQTTESVAAFVHTEWQFLPAWRLNAGLRYTDEQKDFEDAFTYLIAGGAEFPVFPAVSNDYSTEDVSGKLGIDYVGMENALMYASVSRGFKSGGFQGQLTFNPADLQPFDDENVWAYEIGAKARLLDETLQLNGAAFFYDYTDLQFYGGLFDSPVGTLFGIANVGDAEVTGAEVDLWWKPAVGLDVRLGLGLLDTEITKSVVDGVSEGSELPNAPELSFNAMVRYEWALSANLRGDVVLATNYQDDVKFDVVRNPPEAEEAGYWLADARIGITAADGRWSAYLWGRNLTDERYRTQVLFSSVGFGESYGPPRTYGVSFSVSL